MGGLKRLGEAVLLAAIVLALSFAAAWPLWSLATKDARAYTIAVAVAAALAFAVFIAKALRRRRSHAPRASA
jgi:Ca2+/H+ antiporter